MSNFHIVVFFNDYYTLIVAFLTKQIQNRYRYRRVATPQCYRIWKILNWIRLTRESRDLQQTDNMPKNVLYV